MKEEVKQKIIILISIFIGLGVLCILLSIYKSNNNSSPLYQFDNDNKFFSIQSTINTAINDETKNYTVTKILCKNYNETDYCFIKGYLLEFPELSDIIYDNTVSYLLILKGNTYSLEQIKQNDIEEYAKNYSDYKPLESTNILDFINYSESNKLSSYISNFINLTIFDQEKAYELLSNNEKKKIGNLSNFESNISNYQTLSSNITSFTKKDNTYTIIDSNNNTFKIIEESTMNYKIEL